MMSVSHNEKDVIITCEIPRPAGNDTTCNLYVGDQSQHLLKTKIWKKTSSRSKTSFCLFTVTEDDLIRHLQSVGSQEVSCDYRVSSGPNSLSPRSDGYIITNLLASAALIPKTPLRPTTSSTSYLTPTATTSGWTVSATLTSDTPKRTSEGLTVSSTLTTGTPQSSTERDQSSPKNDVEANQESSLVILWLAAVGVASGVGVFLVGLTVVRLCKKTKRKKSQRPPAQQDNHDQRPVGENGESSEYVNVSSESLFYNLQFFVLFLMKLSTRYHFTAPFL
ncbi:uncharacterized protein LOC105006996 [Esox lucius]|uniref:uncharacterized protein LOC105006996 n=1 Tax=Esox lucius TaxID=8010 RepID=UPI0009734952|nr:uncharacterized protein LOC105006996 [Esox lucius]